MGMTTDEMNQLADALNRLDVLEDFYREVVEALLGMALVEDPFGAMEQNSVAIGRIIKAIQTVDGE